MVWYHFLWCLCNENLWLYGFYAFSEFGLILMMAENVREPMVLHLFDMVSSLSFMTYVIENIFNLSQSYN